MKMRLAHRIIVGFTVLILLTGVFGPAVFYQQASKLKESSATDISGVEAYIEEAQTIALTIGVLAVILGVLIMFVLVKQIVTPIQAINIALSEHLKTGKEMKITIPNRDEIGITAIYANEIMSRK